MKHCIIFQSAIPTLFGEKQRSAVPVNPVKLNFRSYERKEMWLTQIFAFTLGANKHARTVSILRMCTASKIGLKSTGTAFERIVKHIAVGGVSTAIASGGVINTSARVNTRATVIRSREFRSAIILTKRPISYSEIACR